MSLELQQAIQSYENYISDNGIDESVIDAMIEACKVASSEKGCEVIWKIEVSIFLEQNIKLKFEN